MKQKLSTFLSSQTRHNFQNKDKIMSKRTPLAFCRIQTNTTLPLFSCGCKHSLQEQLCETNRKHRLNVSIASIIRRYQLLWYIFYLEAQLNRSFVILSIVKLSAWLHQIKLSESSEWTWKSNKIKITNTYSKIESGLWSTKYC